MQRLTSMTPENGLLSVVFGFWRHADMIGMTLKIRPILIFKIEF